MSEDLGMSRHEDLVRTCGATRTGCPELLCTTISSPPPLPEPVTWLAATVNPKTDRKTATAPISTSRVRSTVGLLSEVLDAGVVDDAFRCLLVVVIVFVIIITVLMPVAVVVTVIFVVVVFPEVLDTVIRAQPCAGNFDRGGRACLSGSAQRGSQHDPAQ